MTYQSKANIHLTNLGEVLALSVQVNPLQLAADPNTSSEKYQISRRKIVIYFFHKTLFWLCVVIMEMDYCVQVVFTAVVRKIIEVMFTEEELKYIDSLLPKKGKHENKEEEEKVPEVKGPIVL